MNPFIKLFTSTLGRKYLMALTGLALVGFLAVHLLGNLTLLFPEGKYFNLYAHHLEAMGPLLWGAELGLLALVGVHIVIAISVALCSQQARPYGYFASTKSKGGSDTHSNLSSRNMLIIGIVVGIFLVFHILQFKYGANYRVTIDGQEFRDLHKLVIEKFSNPLWVLFYVCALGFVAFHLRHGIWSALQSLGAMPRSLTKVAYYAGTALAVLMAMGFILLPIWLFIANLAGVFKS